MKKLILIFIFIPNILFAGSMKAIGAKGNEENVDRVIKVLMYDNYYQPNNFCLLYTSPSPRDATLSRMPSSA